MQPRKALSNKDIEDFHRAGSARAAVYVMAEIDMLLDDLQKSHPFRVGRIRADLAWLRRQSRRRGGHL